jgi:uncharacterized membrane protein (UPF0127 family)
VSFDERRARQVLLAAVVVVAVGVYAFVLRGADQPADPFIQPATTTTSLPDVAPPGDPARVPLEGFDEVAVTVDPVGGDDLLSWCLLLAQQAEQRQRGLMEVTDLQGYDGMVFRFDTDSTNGFFMRNTPTPLSIAWIDAAGAVVSTTDMDPCEDREGCPTYLAAGPYRSAIEVFQGGLDDLGIEPGARVYVGGPCAPRT